MNREFDLTLDEFDDSPFFSVISFHKVLESLEQIAQTDTVPYRVAYAEALLAAANQVPELRTGFTSPQVVAENADLIKTLLADLFPTALGKAEIKAVSLPFQNFKFNFTPRFQQLLQDAGPGFELYIRNLEMHQFYIMSCCMILNKCYGEKFDLSRPLYYDIPNKDGVIQHYRITYTIDFLDMIPLENAQEITPEVIELLKANFDNLELWKHYFPKHSWKLLGFGILTLIDVTIDTSLSTLKTNLLTNDDPNAYPRILQDSFQSLFRLKDLRVGLHLRILGQYTDLDWAKNMGINSYFQLEEAVDESVRSGYQQLFHYLENIDAYYCVCDTLAVDPTLPWAAYMQYLAQQNIRSFILTKINSITKYRVHVELISAQPFGLHTVNANKLNAVMPLINDTFERVYDSVNNQLEAIIQREFTRVHPSVHWRFFNEAEHHYLRALSGEPYQFKPITFEQVYPLFGAVDIKSSTAIRNQLTQADTREQLAALQHIFNRIQPGAEILLIEQRRVEIAQYLDKAAGEFSSHMDLQIQSFVLDKIHPLLQRFALQSSVSSLIQEYFTRYDAKQQRFYTHRSAFDTTYEAVNTHLATVIDQAQVVAQHYFPHYFERFRSDGIEHDIFIGASITPMRIFDAMYWHQLRIWQLEVTIQMMLSHYTLSQQLPIQLDLTGLILAYPLPISIHFRLDEKRFDVAGINDVRYEMIKKRIDKAKERGTHERIVQPHKITIVYLNEADRKLYTSYLAFLNQKGLVQHEIEDIELEDLQETQGLHALRVQVIDHASFQGFSTYSDWANFNDSRR